MFKKNLWVAGLIAVLAIMFGCVDALPPPEGEIVEIANLQAIIADKEDGVIEDWGSVFADTPFQKCGNPTFTIITDKGVKKLKIDNMKNNWGEGLDLYEGDNAADKIVGIAAQPGDTIYVKGTINPVGNGLKITNGSGAAQFSGWKSGAEFDETITIAANNIGEIRAGSTKAVRISYGGDSGDGRMGTIILEEVIYKGMRGGTTDVFLDDFTISGLIQEAGWVDGVKVTPNKGKTSGKVTVFYKEESLSDIAANWTTDLDDVQDVGTYDVKFDVAAAKGFYATSFDGLQMRVLMLMPLPFKDTSPMSNITAEGPIKTLVSKQFALLWNNGTPGGLGDEIATANPLAIRGYASVNIGTTTPRIVYPFPTADWKSFDEIKITYEAVITSVDCADSCEAGKCSNTALVGATITGGVLASRQGSAKYIDVTNAYDGGPIKAVVGVANQFTITLPTSDAVFGDGSNGFAFTKNHNKSWVLFKLISVEGYYK
jgi:hypothetical protein